MGQNWGKLPQLPQLFRDARLDLDQAARGPAASDPDCALRSFARKSCFQRSFKRLRMADYHGARGANLNDTAFAKARANVLEDAVSRPNGGM
jgi:hypothetical protein